ncbi:MAG: aconitase X swivel domain-containing protein [Candidatus Heimdallarchaeaceae archaeon]
MKTIKIRSIVGGKVRGEAVVSTLPISFLGGVDGKKGIITDSQNELNGVSLKDKIFIFPESVGSTVGSYVIYSLRVNNVAPLALVANHAETIVIAGAILADIPLVDHPEEEIFHLIKTGDIVEIDTEKGIMCIFNK